MANEQQKPRILIIDDDPNVVIGLRNLLEDDYEIEVATDGADAVELQRQKCCDVIILDMMMPVLDGYQTALKIRAFDPDAQFIVYTGYENTYPLAEVGARVEPIGYLVKGDLDPNNESLLSTIRSALRYRRALHSRISAGRSAGLSLSTSRGPTASFQDDRTPTEEGSRGNFERLRFILSSALEDLDPESVRESVRHAENFLRVGAFPVSTETLMSYYLHLFRRSGLPTPQAFPLRMLLDPLLDRARSYGLTTKFEPTRLASVQAIARPHLLAAVWKGLLEHLVFDYGVGQEQVTELAVEITPLEEASELELIISAGKPEGAMHETAELPESTLGLSDRSLELDVLAARLVMAWFGGKLQHPEPNLARLHFTFVVEK